MSLFPRLLICCLSLLICSACQDDEPKTSPFSVAYLPIAECAQLYVAQERGFFNKAGLEVTLVAASGGQNSVDRVLNTEVDAAFASLATFLINRAAQDAAAGNRLFSVAGASYETSSNQNHAIFMQRSLYDSGLGTGSLAKPDLRYAINEKNRMEHTVLNEYLKLKGIDPNPFQAGLLTFPFSKLYEALQDGSADVACLVEPQISLAKGDTKLVYIDNQYLAVNQNLPTPVATYISSAAVCGAKKKLLQAFATAMQEATDYIRQNPAACRQIIASYTGISESVIAGMGLPEFRAACDAADVERVIAQIGANGFFEGHAAPLATEVLESCH